MIFVRLAFRNIQRGLADYMVYLFTLTAFSALMFSAFIPDSFPAFKNIGDTYVSNSTPVLVALSLLCFMVYVNRFMLRQRSREYAVYMLSGVTKSDIGLLFFTEHFLMGAVAFILGLLLGALVIYVVLSVVSVTWNIADILAAVFKAGAYYFVGHFLSLGIVILFLRRLEIKHLMYQRKYNERRKVTLSRLLLLTAGTILSYVFYIIVVKYAAVQAASAIAPIIGITLYCFYKSLFGWLQWYRNRKGGLLYSNRRLLLAGQALSKVQSSMRICVVISGCLLIALFAATAGYTLISHGGLLDGQLNAVMGFAQVYISVIFTVIVFAIVALRQIIESREYKENHIILKRLGTDNAALNRTLLAQIMINFTMPILAVVLVALGSLPSIERNLYPFLHGENLVTQGALFYFAVLIILYIGYTVMTYKNLKNSGNNLF